MASDKPISQELFQAYASNLRKAINAVPVSDDLAAQWLANVSRFAAYKAYDVTATIRRVVSEDGDIEFGRAVLHTYNRYQAAEYNTAVARARTGKQWLQFSEKDNMRLFPNIKWLPSRSANPREEHMPFYGLIWPKNDPFWLSNQPGSLWNCKCDWEQTDEDPTPNNPSETIVMPGLDQNPATAGQIFTDTAPYIRKAKTQQDIIENTNFCGASLMRKTKHPEKRINTGAGEVIIDNWMYEETAKSNSHDSYYFIKNEVATNLEKYITKFKHHKPEAIDHHNNPRGKAGRRKAHAVQMHTFTGEVCGYSFVVKVLEMESGELKAWSTYIK